jgi:hypothetical protein
MLILCRQRAALRNLMAAHPTELERPPSVERKGGKLPMQHF